MRTLRYYLISIAINGLILGLIYAAAYLTGFTTPRFSVAMGDGSGAAGGNGAPLIEAEFSPPDQATQFRIVPIVRAATNEIAKTEPTEVSRIFAPAVEAKKVVRRLDTAEVTPPRPPLPPEVPKPAIPRPDAAAEVAPPLPVPTHSIGHVDVGALTSAAARAENIEDSSSRQSAPPVGGTGARGGGGGEIGGEPSPFPTNVRPPYPAEALARGIEGKVTLRVLVGEDGSVHSASVEFSSGDQSLDQSALDTVRAQWRFEPAHRGGVPVPLEVRVPISFHVHR